MKTSKFFIITIMVMTSVFLTSCGNKNSKTTDEKSSKTEESSDIPAYAMGEGMFFEKSKDAYPVWGSIEDPSSLVKQKSIYTGYQNYRYDVTVGEESFPLIVSDPGVEKALKNDENVFHFLVTKKADKADYVEEGASYSYNYFYCSSYKLSEAIEFFKALPKGENLPSKFDLKSIDNGKKTYHAKVVKVVEYYGYVNGKYQKMLSIYLDCKAVVQIIDKKLEISRFLDKTVDFAVDNKNNVLDYEIDK